MAGQKGTKQWALAQHTASISRAETQIEKSTHKFHNFILSNPIMLLASGIFEMINYGLIAIVIITAGIFIRKNKRRTAGYILVLFLGAGVPSLIAIQNFTGKLYLVHEDYSTTKYLVFGTPELQFKFRKYTIDPDPGKIMVLNRCFLRLKLERISYESSITTPWEDVVIDAYTSKKIDLDYIDYLPADKIPVSILVKNGESRMRYHLSASQW